MSMFLCRYVASANQSLVMQMQMKVLLTNAFNGT